jgi:hypothetical protein
LDTLNPGLIEQHKHVNQPVIWGEFGRSMILDERKLTSTVGRVKNNAAIEISELLLIAFLTGGFLTSILLA